MVFYHQLVTLVPITPPRNLTLLFRQCARTVIDEGDHRARALRLPLSLFCHARSYPGGVVRQLENHGIKKLPYRFKNHHAPAGSDRRYEQWGRWVSMYFDASPRIMQDVERHLRNNENVLRFTTFKPVTQLEKVNSRKRNDNPWAPFRPISPPLRGDVDLLDATPPPLLESTR